MSSDQKTFTVFFVPPDAEEHPGADIRLVSESEAATSLPLEERREIILLTNMMTAISLRKKYPTHADLTGLIVKHHEAPCRQYTLRQLIPNSTKSFSITADRDAELCKYARMFRTIIEGSIAKKNWFQVNEHLITTITIWNVISDAKYNAEKASQLKYLEAQLEISRNEYATAVLASFDSGVYDERFAEMGFPIVRNRPGAAAAAATIVVSTVASASASPAEPNRAYQPPKAKTNIFAALSQTEKASLPILIDDDTVRATMGNIIIDLAKQKKFPNRENISAALKQQKPEMAADHEKYQTTILFLVNKGIYNKLFATLGFPLTSMRRMLAGLTATAPAASSSAQAQPNAAATTAAAAASGSATTAAGPADLKKPAAGKGSKTGTTGKEESTEASDTAIAERKSAIQGCYEENALLLCNDSKDANYSKSLHASPSKIIKRFMEKSGASLKTTNDDLHKESKKENIKFKRLDEILTSLQQIREQLRDIQSRAALHETPKPKEKTKGEANPNAAKMKKKGHGNGGGKKAKEFRPS